MLNTMDSMAFRGARDWLKGVQITNTRRGPLLVSCCIGRILDETTRILCTHLTYIQKT